jgi:hypothetical protein
MPGETRILAVVGEVLVSCPQKALHDSHAHLQECLDGNSVREVGATNVANFEDRRLGRRGDQRNESVSQIFQQLQVYGKGFWTVKTTRPGCTICRHYSINQDEQLTQGCSVRIAKIYCIGVSLDTECDIVGEGWRIDEEGVRIRDEAP